LSKQLKSELIKQYGCKCFIYLEKVGEIELYENLKQYAIELEKDIPTFIKEIIEREINRNLDG
jgi:hypothetical protein